MSGLANTTDNEKVAAATRQLLGVDPFHSLNVHFGMLLGVEDFRTTDAYHRGKMWLHAAWLHGAGTVWGLRVSYDAASGEIRVAPGLAIDALGREMYLPTTHCLELRAWYEEHKDDADLLEIVEVDEETGEVRFDAHVEMSFQACLTRQVPALSEPCDGVDSGTAYSRIAETLELRLLPGLSPEWRTPPGSLSYHRLRLLFALEAPIEDEDGVIETDQEVLDAIADIQAQPAAQRPAQYLKWFRHFSAQDEMESKPEAGGDDVSGPLFPAQDPAPLMLADVIGIQLSLEEAAPPPVVDRVDNTVRPVLLPTATIQELLCHTPCCNTQGGGAEPDLPMEAPAKSARMEAVAEKAAADAGGPRVDLESVAIEGEFISFHMVGILMKASVDVRALSVTSFDVRDGWIAEEIKGISYDPDEKKITVELRDDPGGRLVRLIVKGTGPFPLLGRNRIPLAGSVGGKEVGSRIEGNDVITMFKTRIES